MGSSSPSTLTLCAAAVFFFFINVEAQNAVAQGGCRVCSAECQKFPRADGGCAACVCDGIVLSECPPISCPIFCAIDMSDDGCRMCNCNKSAVICPPIRPCPGKCQRMEDDNGCPTCQCPENVNPSDTANSDGPTCPSVPVCPLGCIDTVTIQGNDCFSCNCTLVPPTSNPFAPGLGGPSGFGNNPFSRPNNGVFRPPLFQNNERFTPSGRPSRPNNGLLSHLGRPNGISRPGNMPTNQRQPMCGETQCAPQCRLCVGRDGCGRCLCGRNANICPAVPACRQSCISRGSDGCLTCSCPAPVRPGPFSPFRGNGGGFNPFRIPIRPFGASNGGAITLIITNSDAPDFDDTGIISTSTGVLTGPPPGNSGDDDVNLAVIDPFNIVPGNLGNSGPPLAVVSEPIPIDNLNSPPINLPFDSNINNGQGFRVPQPGDPNYFDQGLVEQFPVSSDPNEAPLNVNPQGQNLNNILVSNIPNDDNVNPIGVSIPNLDTNINREPMIPENVNPIGIPNPNQDTNINREPMIPENVNPIGIPNPNQDTNINREPMISENVNPIGIPNQNQNPNLNREPMIPESVPILPVDQSPDISMSNIPLTPGIGGPPLPNDVNSPPGETIDGSIPILPTTEEDVPITTDAVVDVNDIFARQQINEAIKRRQLLDPNFIEQTSL